MTLSEAQELAERAIHSALVTAHRAENVVYAFRVCLEWTCATDEQKRAWCERVTREYEAASEPHEARANGSSKGH